LLLGARGICQAKNLEEVMAETFSAKDEAVHRTASAHCGKWDSVLR